MGAPVNVLVKAKDQSGNPLIGAIVTARLSNLEVFANDGYVVSERMFGTTDATGQCVIQVLSNALGATESHYIFEIKNPDTGSIERIEATIPNADCELHAVANLPPYPGKTDGQIAIDEAIAAVAPAIEAKLLAQAAAVIATTQAGLATAAANTIGTAVTDSQAYAASALISKNAAVVSASSASTSETNALSYKDTVVSAASAALVSETNAANSAGSAFADAATTASQSIIATNAASTAVTQANNASTYATAALGSANSAAADKVITAGHVSAASLSETNANSSAVSAAASLLNVNSLASGVATDTATVISLAATVNTQSGTVASNTLAVASDASDVAIALASIILLEGTATSAASSASSSASSASTSKDTATTKASEAAASAALAEAAAEAATGGQVNSDWAAVSGKAEILNKPTIPAGQVQADWDAITGLSMILNKPTIPAALGYTAENADNKSTALDTDKASNTKYPSVKAVFDWASGVFVPKNPAITAGTKTKLTYDTKGLVLSGADATTADIADSTDKRYVTDAEKTKVNAITLGGNLTTSGAFTSTFTMTGNTTVTFPTTGTLAILGTNNYTGAQNTARATVASHATTAPIWAATGNQIDFTGTATVTAFPNAPQAGAERILICAGACSFTASANMLIDGVASGATVTCAANDKMIVRAISATQFMLSRVKADGTAQVSNGGGDLVRLAGSDFSAVSSIDFTSLFTSTYDSYRVVISNVTQSTGSVITLGFGTPTILNTGILSSHLYIQSAAPAQYSSSLPWLSAIGATKHAYSIEIGVKSGSRCSAHWTGIEGDSVVIGNMNVPNTGTVTRLLISAGGGTISGTVQIYGYKKS